MRRDQNICYIFVIKHLEYNKNVFLSHSLRVSWPMPAVYMTPWKKLRKKGGPFSGAAFFYAWL